LLFTGCSAAFVVATFDPYKKPGHASALLDVGRPLPAERLILEAIDIFQKKDDPQGLAFAYNEYAFF